MHISYRLPKKLRKQLQLGSLRAKNQVKPSQVTRSRWIRWVCETRGVDPAVDREIFEERHGPTWSHLGIPMISLWPRWSPKNIWNSWLAVDWQLISAHWGIPISGHLIYIYIYIYTLYIPVEAKHFLFKGTANPLNHTPDFLPKKVQLDP